MSCADFVVLCFSLRWVFWYVRASHAAVEAEGFIFGPTFSGAGLETCLQ